MRFCHKLCVCAYCCWRCLNPAAHQTKASAAAVNVAAATRVCFTRKSSSSLPPMSTVCTAATVLGSFEAWQDSSNDRV